LNEYCDYELIDSLWDRLKMELITVERDLLVMKERLGFVANNYQTLSKK